MHRRGIFIISNESNCQWRWVGCLQDCDRKAEVRCLKYLHAILIHWNWMCNNVRIKHKLISILQSTKRRLQKVESMTTPWFEIQNTLILVEETETIGVVQMWKPSHMCSWNNCYWFAHLQGLLNFAISFTIERGANIWNKSCCICLLM